jgi:hypothetical protein
MSAQGLPFFEASTLDGAADTLHNRLNLHPTDDFFPFRLHEGAYVELDVKKWETYAADPVDWGVATPHADPHGFRTVRATPVQLRNGRPLSNKEVSFFRNYGQIRQTAGVTRTQEARRQELITDIARETMMPPEERKHVMQCEALRGSVSLQLGGQTVVTSYGLNALTVPTVPWATVATSTPVQDIYDMREEFLEHAEVLPDTVFFNRGVFASYFTRSPEWREVMQQNPDMAKAFTGFLPADGDLRRLAVPNQPFEMFDMLWVPVSGRYKDQQGNTNDRWPLEDITVAALAAGDGQRVLEWGTTMDEYCPDGDDPIGYMTEYTVTGVPVIRIKERVQTWRVST